MTYQPKLPPLDSCPVEDVVQSIGGRARRGCWGVREAPCAVAELQRFVPRAKPQVLLRQGGSIFTPRYFPCAKSRILARQGSGMEIKAAMETGARFALRPPRQARVGLRFHAAVALIIAASMVGGFYFELSKYVIHPQVHFPGILPIHSAVFVGWMALYLAQTLLVQTRKVWLHRLLGWFGLALALAMPPLGVATALIMRRFDIITFHSHELALDLAFLATPLADIIAFTPCAWIGIAMRKRRDYHSRLMFLAISSVAETGFGRLPIPGATKWFFVSNLVFYAAGMIHDRVTIGRVHRVYRIAVPLIVLDEAIAMMLWLYHPGWWVATCRWLIGLP